MRNRAAVIADHLEAGLPLVIKLLIIETRQPSSRLDQWVNNVSFIVIRDALQNLSHPLQAHAGINIAVREWGEIALPISVVLHKNQVVELNKTTVVFQINVVVAQIRLEVVIDLRTRSTGASRP
ncbi:MAG: Uncharacterised protein [Prochlorococcus marinus str. MIT 9313]|nr:MAG: Uncharacterised protein [Prochlorococcus marinus str. MIT 9313]